MLQRDLRSEVPQLISERTLLMKKLTVCGHDIAEFTLVIPAIPHPAVTTAAEFLRDTIAKACGVDLPIADKAEHGIYIGTRGACDCVKHDGFRITTDSTNVYLDGNMERGTLYAAFSFAEKYIGYRYFADDCIVIPTEGSGDVPANLNIIDNPGFPARRTTFSAHMRSAAYSAHARLNDCMPCKDDIWGGSKDYSGACHSFGKYCSGKVYFKEHPEYFALALNEETNELERMPCEPGTGPGQLCLTNPDVLRVVTENILKELREHPETEIVEFSQADTENYCRCPSCAAVDAEEESHAGTLIRFVNALGEAIEKEFPNVLIRTFAYQYTSTPPKHTAARHNILIRYCTMDACFRHAVTDPACKVNSIRFHREMEEWKTKCHQLSIWDYLCNWRSFLLPYPNLISLRENARYFAECGAIHVLEEVNPWNNAGGAYSALNCYLTGILLWDPYMSEEEYFGHIKEFLMAYYGKGWREIAECMRIEYAETAENCILCMDENVDDSRRFYREYKPYPYQTIKPNNALTALAARYDELTALLDRADALAETDAEHTRIDAMRLSFDYMEHSCVAHEKDKMTAEERAAHEAKLESIMERKKKHGFYWNLSTANNDNGGY